MGRRSKTNPISSEFLSKPFLKQVNNQLYSNVLVLEMGICQQQALIGSMCPLHHLLNRGSFQEVWGKSADQELCQSLGTKYDWRALLMQNLAQYSFQRIYAGFYCH